MDTKINQNISPVFFIIIILLSCFAGAVISRSSPMLSIGAILAVVIFTVSFIDAKISLYVLIFSMLLSPEIMMSSLGGKEVAGRGVTFRLEDFLLVVIAMGWFTKAAIYKEVGLVLKTPLNRPILAYVVISLSTTLIGAIQGRVVLKTGFFFVLKYIEYYVIYFMVVNNVKTEKEIKQFMTAIFITAAIVCITAMMQIPSGQRVAAPFEGEDSEPNTLGGYLVLILSFSMGLIFNIKSKKKKIWLSLLCLLSITPLLFTLSRASWFALVPMYLMLFFYSNKKILLISILVITSASGFFFLPENVKSRFTSTFQEQKGFARSESVGGVGFDPSTSERINRFKSTFIRFQDYPILGRGVTGAGFIDGQYARVLEEAGLLGLIVFLWIAYALFNQSLSLLRETSNPYFKGLALGMLACLISLLVHAIGGNTFIIVRIMEPFWFLAGLIIVAKGLEEKELAPK